MKIIFDEYHKKVIANLPEALVDFCRDLAWKSAVSRFQNKLYSSSNDHKRDRFVKEQWPDYLDEALRIAEALEAWTPEKMKQVKKEAKKFEKIKDLMFNSRCYM